MRIRSSWRALAERDRGARVSSVLPDSEPEVLPVADGGRCNRLGCRHEERHVRVREAERRELVELPREPEREVGSRDHGVHDCHVVKVHVAQVRVGVCGERVRERLDSRRVDGEPRRRPMPTEPVEMLRAGSEGAVEIEARYRPPRALPAVVRPRDEHDRPVRTARRASRPRFRSHPRASPRSRARSHAFSGRAPASTRRGRSRDAGSCPPPPAGRG